MMNFGSRDRENAMADKINRLAIVDGVLIAVAEAV